MDMDPKDTNPDTTTLNLEKLYKLANILTKALESIEILPGDGHEWIEHPPHNHDPDASSDLKNENKYDPFLLIEGNLGIPEQILYELYVIALHQFSILKDKWKRSGETEFASGEELLHVDRITRVILLVNPAHQTALSFRRFFLIEAMGRIRLGVRSSIQGGYDPDPELLQGQFEQTGISCQTELNYIAALFSFKTCAKDSTLWHYRRFLLDRRNSLRSRSRTDRNDPKDLSREDNRHTSQTANDEIAKIDGTFIGGPDFGSNFELPLEDLRRELEVIAKACELYPRNYYAWYHRFLCLRAYCTGAVRKIHHLQNDVSIEEKQDFRVESKTSKVISDEFAFTKRWIEQHISDYSAVNYVFQLVDLARHLRNDCTHYVSAEIDHHPQDTRLLKDELVSHAWSLLQAFPSHETLWLYTRQALDLPFSPQKDHDTLSQDISEFASSILMASTTSTQIQEHSVRTGSIQFKGNIYTISEFESMTRNALHFLLWCDKKNNTTKTLQNFFPLSGNIAPGLLLTTNSSKN